MAGGSGGGAAAEVHQAWPFCSSPDPLQEAASLCRVTGPSKLRFFRNKATGLGGQGQGAQRPCFTPKHACTGATWGLPRELPAHLRQTVGLQGLQPWGWQTASPHPATLQSVSPPGGLCLRGWHAPGSRTQAERSSHRPTEEADRDRKASPRQFLTRRHGLALEAFWCAGRDTPSQTRGKACLSFTLLCSFLLMALVSLKPHYENLARPSALFLGHFSQFWI